MSKRILCFTSFHWFSQIVRNRRFVCVTSWTVFFVFCFFFYCPQLINTSSRWSALSGTRWRRSSPSSPWSTCLGMWRGPSRSPTRKPSRWSSEVPPLPSILAPVRVSEWACECVLTSLAICSRQTLPDAVHQAHPDPARAAGGRREEDLLSEPCEGRASLLLQRVWCKCPLLSVPSCGRHMTSVTRSLSLKSLWSFCPFPTSSYAVRSYLQKCQQLCGSDESVCRAICLFFFFLSVKAAG